MRARPLIASAALVAGFSALVSVLSTPVSAEIIDPSTFHVGTGAGTAGATGLGGDPNTIGSGATFDIYQNSEGNVTGLQPLLIILAVPDNAGIPSLSSTGTLYRPYPGSVTTTITINQSLGYGFAGYAQGSNMASDDIYTFLSTKTTHPIAAAALAHGNNSFNIGNMNDAELADNGLTVTSYDVYLWQALTDMQPNDLLDLTGNLPLGTFVSAFAEEAASCPDKKDSFDSCAPVVVPFTESGLTTLPGGSSHQDIPEPGTLMILGTALAGLGLLGRRRRKV
jgi:hypothetical protein